MLFAVHEVGADAEHNDRSPDGGCPVGVGRRDGQRCRETAEDDDEEGVAEGEGVDG